MKKDAWLLLFIIFLAVNITGIIINNETIQLLSKPLIIPSLAFWFLTKVKLAEKPSPWILIALAFSWIGDVLLMFQEKNSIFFLTGLVAFLLAHISYIIFFHKIRVVEKIRSNPWLMIPVVLYYVGLIAWLSPYLADMKLPVRIYGIVISFMLMMALHMPFIRNKKAGQFMFTGALLFIISDSLLAINKFYQSFEAAGTLIMLSYGLAQLLIVYGAMKYIRGETGIAKTNSR